MREREFSTRVLEMADRPVRSPGSVEIQIKRISESLDRLGGVVVDLTNQLKPIMREESTDASKGIKGGEITRAGCPLADDLDGINNSIQHQVEVLMSIIHRSEL